MWDTPHVLNNVIVQGHIVNVMSMGHVFSIHTHIQAIYHNFVKGICFFDTGDYCL